MKSLTLLNGLREYQILSQRALAEKSGVAHDTIGQLERGERKARPSTVRKLADALNVSPSILTSSLEDLQSLSGEELKRMGAPEAVETVRDYLVWVGHVNERMVWKQDLVHKRRLQEEFDPASTLADIDQAYTKINPYEDKSNYKGALVERAEAALLLARSSAQLLQQVADELPAQLANERPAENKAFVKAFAYTQRKEIEKLATPLVEAWLEGSAATKRLLDIIEHANLQLGSQSLEIESEESAEGGAHQDVRRRL